MRFDEVAQVGGVDVDRFRFVFVGDLFVLNEQEAPRHLKEFAVLGQGFESHLLPAVPFAQADPVCAEPLQVFVQGHGAAFVGCRIDPFAALGQNVVVGQREEMVAVLFVPIDDHFRIVIAIAPERMGVQIAFPPRGLCGAAIGDN